MPLENDVIDRIEARFSAEGLHNTMTKNKNILRQSDYVWILTDGMIDDKELDKKYYHKLGIRTHAMYIGTTSYKEQMLKSFDYVICEKNITDLAKVIFTLIK
ncbi:MAG: hypothetical protein Q9M43_15955 [Sulfurimonas sp.]|nr:hypothetical protein [Sulfurimonas sp.]